MRAWTTIGQATHYDYEIKQMEIKTTFLNGNLGEEVNITHFEGPYI